jgi:hypothetical protein
MNEVDRRLDLAMKGDTRHHPVENTWFAWYPVVAWDYIRCEHRTVWLIRIRRLKILGISWEYFMQNAPL